MLNILFFRRTYVCCIPRARIFVFMSLPARVHFARVIMFRRTFDKHIINIIIIIIYERRYFITYIDILYILKTRWKKN